MTLAQIEEAARNKYNSIGSSFYSSQEIYNLIYEAELNMAREGLVIEGTVTTPTVVNQQTYNYPSEVVAFKRITWNGIKLTPIDFRLDDQLTLNNSITDQTQDPQYYWTWNNQVYLRPVPSSVEDLTMYVIKKPAYVTAGGTVEVPDLFHMDIVNFVVSEMAFKDKQADIAAAYYNRWIEGLKNVRKWSAEQKVTDAFKVVKDEESLSTNILGPI